MTDSNSLHGQRLGHYLVGEVIGLGSFATVYRATDERLDGTVVLKVLAENHSLNPEIRERFIAEGRSLRRVGGTHAIAVHDIGESDRQQPYLVLELADRGTLRQRVEGLWQQEWRASRADVLTFSRALAAAVDAVHRARLVHRDLSPGNLLLATRHTGLGSAGRYGSRDLNVAETGAASAVVCDDEQLLIADLGMCKDLALNSGLTVAAGTSGFRPPEQHGPGTVDIRADIWAMSALLEWLTQGADLPRSLRRVLRRGMAQHPVRRQPDARTWLAEVEEALAPVAGPSTVTPAQQPTAGASARRGGLRLVRTVVVAACALALGVLGGYLLRGPESPLAQTDQAAVAIEGPEEVAVGEPVSFTAQLSGVTSWTWLLPTGRYVADEEQVRLTPTVPGRAEMILRARAPDGSELQARHTVRVVN